MKVIPKNRAIKDLEKFREEVKTVIKEAYKKKNR